MHDVLSVNTQYIVLRDGSDQSDLGSAIDMKILSQQIEKGYFLLPSNFTLKY